MVDRFLFSYQHTFFCFAGQNIHHNDVSKFSGPYRGRPLHKVVSALSRSGLQFFVHIAMDCFRHAAPSFLTTIKANEIDQSAAMLEPKQNV